MRYVRIPGTDLDPSAICMGTSLIGTAIDPDSSFALLDAYVEQGGNFLDTALIYADWLSPEKGASERTIGKWLRLRRNRDRVILATKGCTFDVAAPGVPRLSRADLEHDLNRSLENLRTDSIDIYWLHRDDPQRPVEDIVQTLNDQVRAGKVRYCACSNWPVDRIAAARDYARRCGYACFVANQMMWSYAVVHPQAVYDKTMVLMDDAMKRYHLDTQLAAIPYSAQARGWFQRMARNTEKQMHPDTAKLYRSAPNERRFARASRLAAESALSITDVVLAYLTSQPFPSIPIVGCRNPEQLRDSMKAGDVLLTRDQLDYLETGVPGPALLTERETGEVK